jgi:hypothetical protein
VVFGIWHYLAASGDIWRYLMVVGGIWRHLVVFGGIWRYLAVWHLGFKWVLLGLLLACWGC